MTLEEMRLEILKLHKQVWKLEVLTSGWKANLLCEYLNRITKLEAANDAHEREFLKWKLAMGVPESEFPRPATSSEQEELPVVD
jgi:hypothetical protein